MGKTNRYANPAYREYNRLKCREYRLAHLAEARAHGILYRQTHKEQIKAKQLQWRIKNREKIAQASRDWRAANPETRKVSAKRSRIKQKYGLSLEQLEQMKLDQGGACAICARVLPLVVDHNHTTGAVRGLLCVVCNQAIGMLQESQSVLENAKNYLKRYELTN